jgi:hypothetical protein
MDKYPKICDRLLKRAESWDLQMRNGEDNHQSSIPNVIPFPTNATPKKKQRRAYFPTPELLTALAISQKVHLIWVEEIIQRKLDQQLRLKIMSELFADWLKQQFECVNA